MKKIKIIALIGKSGAGKDYWLHRICSKDKEVHEIISCTTRPARWQEENGKNYYFLTDEQFLNEAYVEHCEFNRWRYGTREKDLSEDKVNIGVFNLKGIKQLVHNQDIDLTIIHIKAPDRVRLIRQLERLNDDDNIAEVLRRYAADEADFNLDQRKVANELSIPYYCIFNSDGNVKPNEEFIRQIITEVKSK